MELEGRRKALAGRGLGLAAISPDPVPLLREFAGRRGIGFPLLSDPGSSIIRDFGVLDEGLAAADPQHGIPHPGTLVIDARGTVTKREFASGYAERRTVASLLDLPISGTVRVDAPGGVRVTLSSSDTTVTMGRRLTLRADLELPGQTHVYAPGAEGYAALHLELDPHAMMTLGEIRLPRPRILKFKPTKERLPVLHGPRIRLEADVVVAAGKPFVEWLEADPKQLVVTGTLTFQSCSRATCQPPVRLPVSWTLEVVPPDFERSPEELRASMEAGASSRAR